MLAPLLSLAASGFVLPPGSAPALRRAAPGQAAPALMILDELQKKATSAFQRGVVVPTKQGAEAPAARSKVEEKEEGELSIGELLRQYGVIALFFHFSVWITTLTVTFTAISVAGTDALANLAAAVPALAGVLGEGGEGATSSLGALAVTLALVEAIGPARLALTVAVTPAVSERARQYAVVRDTEARIMQAAEGVLARLPGSRE